MSDIIFDHADVAQLVEQLIRNEKVDSSIPSIGTSNDAGHSSVTFFSFWNGLTRG